MMAKGVERVLAKLKLSIQDGKHYEALQMYRTLYFRYLSQKKFQDLENLMFDGAVIFFSNGEQHSGVDLAMLYLDTLKKSEVSPSDLHFSRLAELFSLISTENPDRSRFVCESIKWSGKGLRNVKAGHPDLHARLAQCCWNQGNYEESRYHFLRSNDSKAFANMLTEFHLKKGLATEVDLFIAQAVLQSLCIQDQGFGKSLLVNYSLSHPAIGSSPPNQYPLLNFLWFVVMALEQGRLSFFTVLVDKYSPSLARDPTYKEYVDRIAQIFFNVPPPVTSRGGIFENLLNTLMTGMDDTSDEEDDRAHFRVVDRKPSTSARNRPSQVRKPGTEMPKVVIDDDID
ncbi:unnamed protein product [Cyprideis torosa]|uniref:Uncharacterized protein n=1 Tax=Cyprideis torosa TaxID=163714 RepID=A0A7R8WBA5_9CRUS|nr:unnamed protein product [Cyprideis torosa]CAG0886224.1 unnamed protein product [Cyprideis torosa]